MTANPCLRRCATVPSASSSSRSGARHTLGASLTAPSPTSYARSRLPPPRLLPVCTFVCNVGSPCATIIGRTFTGGAPGRLLDVLLRNRTRPPQDFTAAAFRSIVGQVFSVCRDYVCDEQTLYSLVQRTIAHYRRVARTRNSMSRHAPWLSLVPHLLTRHRLDPVVSLEEPSRLYQASQPFFRSLVNGEDLLVMQRLQGKPGRSPLQAPL